MDTKPIDDCNYSINIKKHIDIMLYDDIGNIARRIITYTDTYICYNNFNYLPHTLESINISIGSHNKSVDYLPHNVCEITLFMTKDCELKSQMCNNLNFNIIRQFTLYGIEYLNNFINIFKLNINDNDNNNGYKYIKMTNDEIYNYIYMEFNINNNISKKLLFTMIYFIKF